MIYWISFVVPDLSLEDFRKFCSLYSKDIFPLFLAHINLCTEEVNVCLCEAVDYTNSLLGVGLM